MSWQQQVSDLLTTVCGEFRKGAEVTEDANAPQGMIVKHVWQMPHIDEANREEGEFYDLHFVWIGVHVQGAAEKRDEFVALCDSYPEPERLAGGPSFIELGSVLGSQDLALMWIALGVHYGLWEAVTPEKLGIDDPAEADRLAGQGMVMMTGYSKEVPA